MERYIKVLFILLTASVLVNGCGNNPANSYRTNANYYRSVDIGGKHEIRGRYPITDKETNKVTIQPL